MNEFTFKFDENQIERLARLSPNNDWKEALEFHVNALISEKVGRPKIFGHSQKGTVKVQSGDY